MSVGAGQPQEEGTELLQVGLKNQAGAGNLCGENCRRGRPSGNTHQKCSGWGNTHSNSSSKQGDGSMLSQSSQTKRKGTGAMDVALHW